MNIQLPLGDKEQRESLNKRDPRCKPLESALPGLFCHFSQDISFVVAVATVKLEIRVPSLAIDEY